MASAILSALNLNCAIYTVLKMDFCENCGFKIYTFYGKIITLIYGGF